MKRFLRYILYREAYRWIRNAGSSNQSNSSKPLNPDKPADNRNPSHSTNPIPLDDGPIETVSELQTVLQHVDEYQFEHFIADLWERMGWSTEVSSASVDEGVDVVARRSTPYEETTVIQAKRYGSNTTVGSPDIQQYASLRHQYDGIDTVLVVTTNEFTGQARDLADRLNVKLINGEKLAELVAQHDALDLVAEHVDFVEAIEGPSDHPDSMSRDEVKGPTSEPGSVSRAGDVPSTIWAKAVLVGIPTWIVTFFSVTVLPDVLWGLLFFVVWLGLPVALYLDARTVREHVDWPSHTWAYVLGSLVWLFAVIPAGIYVWRRRSFTDKSTNGSSAEPTTADGIGEDHGQRANTRERSESGTTPTDGSTATPVESERATEEDSTVDAIDDWMHVEHDGERHFAQTTTSPNGEYIAAYKDGRHVDGSPEPGRVFLLTADEELAFTTEISRPNACAVANDGTLAVVDWNLDWGDELSGTFHVFNASGHKLLTHEYDANLGPCAITADGEYAATSTFNPDCTTYIFDAQAGDLLTDHENEHGNVQSLEFVEDDGSLMLRLGDPTEDAAYGIDLAGHVVWKSDALRRQERLEELLNSSEDASLHEALDLLEEAADLASEDWEHRNITQRAADAHWQLAKNTKQERGVTDDWWEHMQQAYEQYIDALPRYAGKQGAAKVQRALGKQYLNQGDKEQALACFQDIARLEEEYDVQLLTDADRRRLDELNSRLADDESEQS